MIRTVFLEEVVHRGDLKEDKVLARDIYTFGGRVKLRFVAIFLMGFYDAVVPGILNVLLVNDSVTSSH